MVPELNCQLVEKIAAELWMRDRSPPEEDSQLHLVTTIKKPCGLPALGLEVVITDLRLDADFLQLDDMLVAPGVPLFAALLISEFAVIH